MESSNGENPVSAVLEAAHFAAQQHCHQRRKGDAQEPYINHLLEVASLVASAPPQPQVEVVIAALLHDTLEDTDLTRETLAARFGERVAELVEEVTDDKSLPRAQRKRLQVEHAPHLSEGAQRIKLADKISNLRGILQSTPAGWDERRCRDYFAWAKQVADALPHPNPSLRAEFDRVFGAFTPAESSTGR